MWVFKNYFWEMQAAETVASVIWETPEMPWEFHYEGARHCWDEVRHSNMGKARLEELGLNPMEFPHMNSAYGMRQEISPLERYTMLTMVSEAMDFPFMRERMAKLRGNGDLDSAEYMMFDISDETNHVRFGKKWLPRLMETYGEPRSARQLIDDVYAHYVNRTKAMNLATIGKD